MNISQYRKTSLLRFRLFSDLIAVHLIEMLYGIDFRAFVVLTPSSWLNTEGLNTEWLPRTISYLTWFFVIK